MMASFIGLKFCKYLLKINSLFEMLWHATLLWKKNRIKIVIKDKIFSTHFFQKFTQNSTWHAQTIYKSWLLTGEKFVINLSASNKIFFFSGDIFSSNWFINGIRHTFESRKACKNQLGRLEYLDVHSTTKSNIVCYPTLQTNA